MSTTHHAPSGSATGGAPLRNLVGTDRAFQLLHIVFTVAPILFGLDKFVGLLTNWDQYLAPWIDNIVPGTAHQAMMAVGVVEIIAGLVVWFAPRFGGPLVALWLAGIILNLLTLSGFYDVALRDFGLFVAALALTALAWDRPRSTKA